MAYVKNIWVDQEVERPKTYEVTNNQDGSITLTDSFGLVTELGTPVNEVNMNHIEDGIEGCAIRKHNLTETFNLGEWVLGGTGDNEGIYKSLVSNNVGNAISDDTKWEKVELGGGGLEIGDIGIAPLGIDETQNKRRYLNGQIIIQDQYTSFTTKLKSAVQLYPSLACTEAQWQATVTLSVGGQCGKFVIDNTAGTIRLPKIIMPIQGLTNLANLAEIVEAGLPNITGKFVGGNQNGTVSGAFEFDNNSNSAQGGSNYREAQMSFDASNSSSIYGNSTTVQQEQIQYPYFIQVATGVEESIDVVREIEFNNPFSLLEPKWSDKLINNVSWLRSNGQSNSSSVYADAYDLILTEYNGSTDETETIGSTTITFRRGATTGMKITVDKTAFDSIYSEVGTAWYFVLDTENSAFYLPRSNGFMQFGGTGNFVEAGLPNITGTAYGDEFPSGLATTGAFYDAGKFSDSATGSSQPSRILGLDASRSNSIYGNSTTVQPPSVQGYLYFYVGETVQNASLINAGRIEEKLADKADVDLANVNDTGYIKMAGAGMPSNTYIDLTLGASGTQYIAPANGWYNLRNNAGSTNNPLALVNISGSGICVMSNTGVTGFAGNEIFLPCKKGDLIEAYYITPSGSITSMRFIYAQGSESEAS